MLLAFLLCVNKTGNVLCHFLFPHTVFHSIKFTHSQSCFHIILCGMYCVNGVNFSTKKANWWHQERKWANWKSSCRQLRSQKEMWKRSLLHIGDDQITIHETSVWSVTAVKSQLTYGTQTRGFQDKWEPEMVCHCLPLAEASLVFPFQVPSLLSFWDLKIRLASLHQRI